MVAQAQKPSWKQNPDSSYCLLSDSLSLAFITESVTCLFMHHNLVITGRRPALWRNVWNTVFLFQWSTVSSWTVLHEKQKADPLTPICLFWGFFLKINSPTGKKRKRERKFPNENMTIYNSDLCIQVLESSLRSDRDLGVFSIPSQTGFWILLHNWCLTHRCINLLFSQHKCINNHNYDEEVRVGSTLFFFL